MRSRTARRLVEWSILVIVVLLLAGIFGQQVRTVQAQAELAAVRSTLGALRTALVIDHMIATIRTGGPSVASPQRNPFLLMDPVPANYAGALGTQWACGADHRSDRSGQVLAGLCIGAARLPPRA